MNMDIKKPIWVEDESRSIGSIQIPHHFFEWMRSAPAIFLEVPRAQRVRHIADQYGSLPRAELCAAIQRIAKRLGGQNVIAASEALKAGDFDQCISILLAYYDKLYLANKAKLDRRVFAELVVEDEKSHCTTQRLIEFANSLRPVQT
jgi:tRNA 2-selenouridine synthase